MTPPRLFDVYLALDWSAKSTPSRVRPSKDALWLAEQCVEGIAPYQSETETYHRTRIECETHLYALLTYHLNKNHRLFLGVDFALGYPMGFASALGHTGDSPAWWYLWETLADLIQEGERNRNNRFQVAAMLNERLNRHLFWGGPLSAMSPYLRATLTRGQTTLPRLRLTEQALAPLPIQETWKLFGAGAVGGQTLLGIPFVHRLRTHPHFRGSTRVFPFETNALAQHGTGGKPLVIAEIYPSMTPLPYDPALIRDRSQVRNTASHFAALDATGNFDALLTLPPSLNTDEQMICAQEEGWIVGVAQA